jgi:hypothetical protein
MKTQTTNGHSTVSTRVGAGRGAAMQPRNPGHRMIPEPFLGTLRAWAMMAARVLAVVLAVWLLRTL